LTARMKRIMSDFENIKKDFFEHKNIIVTPENTEYPEKYFVTYFLNGIYFAADGQLMRLDRHDVEITLHAEYPRYKPVCKIMTPIFHPNFKDGQICIGDIWGAGESLTDIIINIGDMIQYKSWNSFSPLSADAAKWAMENKHLFPIGNVELINAEQVPVEIGEPITIISESNGESSNNYTVINEENDDFNDFDITAEDLFGVQFVPTADRMQSAQMGQVATGKGINLKTVLMKGLLWGLIGGVIGWIVQEVFDLRSETVLEWMGYGSRDQLINDATITLTQYRDIVKGATRISTAFFAAFIALGVGSLLGLGEGIYYGSKEKALKYLGIGAGISLVLGFISGYICQFIYSSLLTDTTSEFAAAFVRGIGWSIMGIGVGLAVGLIKPEKKRILFCSLGGLGGGFIGGFLFNYIFQFASTGDNDTGTVPRAIGIIIMGALIGVGIGILEQFAKSAWLKVVRGEFEGKEYLVFSGITSIGNTGKNTIVLFKDRLVGPNHCDIVLEGHNYVLFDKGTPMGTIVNGQRISRHVLRKGDAISIGNSVLIFNTK